jgi:phage regulator Rha-like protein
VQGKNEVNELSPHQSVIQNKIFTIRNVQVMLDRDLAELYGVEIKVLNQSVKRNIARFPDHYCFQLSEDEWVALRSQFVTLNDAQISQRGQHRKYLPYVFTEQGVTMLSAVLRSETAIRTSIRIVDTFVSMRRFMSQNALLFERMNAIERRQYVTDTKVDAILDAIEAKDTPPAQGVFYEGQIFDAYTFVSDLVRSAGKRIVLIDNYVDDTTLMLLSKNQQADITIYTQSISKQLVLDIAKYNSQYKPITVNELKTVHDRFLILDNQSCYLIGASLKDLGKKLFGFSKLDKVAFNLVAILPNMIVEQEAQACRS